MRDAFGNNSRRQIDWQREREWMVDDSNEKKCLCFFVFAFEHEITWTQCIMDMRALILLFLKTLLLEISMDTPLRFTKCAETIFICMCTMRRKYFRLSWAQALTQRVSVCRRFLSGCRRYLNKHSHHLSVPWNEWNNLPFDLFHLTLTLEQL